MDILPLEKELPENVLGTPVDIKFSSTNKVIRIDNLDNSPLIIEKDRIHGVYTIDADTTIKARDNLDYKEYSKMSQVPKGIDLYYYKPVSIKSFRFRYLVHTEKESKEYFQIVKTDWSTLSEGVRNYVRTSL